MRIDRVMTDNGSGYVSRAFRAVCVELGIRHIRTRPYTPKTNGKAERPVQTCLRERAYASPTRAQPNDRLPCSPSLTATTGVGHTPLSDISHPSLVSQM